MTTMAVPGPPEHLTDATAGLGVGSGDGVGVGRGVGEAAALGVGSSCCAGEIVGLANGEVKAVGETEPHAIAIAPENKRAEQRRKLISRLKRDPHHIVMRNRIKVPLQPPLEQRLLGGSFPGGCLPRCRFLHRRLRMDALGEHLLTRRAVPLLVLLVGDLPLDEQLCELPALRLAFEGHDLRLAKPEPPFGHKWGRAQRSKPQLGTNADEGLRDPVTDPKTRRLFDDKCC